EYQRRDPGSVSARDWIPDNHAVIDLARVNWDRHKASSLDGGGMGWVGWAWGGWGGTRRGSRDARQYAPVPPITAEQVFHRICRPRANHQLSTSRISSRPASSHDRSDRPLTCHRPVMPGLTARRRRIRLQYRSVSSGRAGLGPTSDMSPN